MKTKSVTKPTFVLLVSYLKQLEKLSREQRGDWITAILCYVNDEPLPEMDPAVDMFFSVVKEQLDTYHERWSNTCEARRIAGSRGGQATARNRQNAANAAFAAANATNQADNDTVYDNDIDTATVNDTVYANNHRSYPSYSRSQSLKDARKGMEHGDDLDAIVLEQIRNRHCGVHSDDSDNVFADLGIKDQDESGWSV